jgi:hypothetical protein
MKTLSIISQGVKGTQSKEEKKGYISVYSGNTKVLSIDNYLGAGDSYEQRKEPILVIWDEDNNIIFEGTHAQLTKKLI